MSHTDPFDPALFGGPLLPPDGGRKKATMRPSGAFLKGPIPWVWIEVAARLPGQALAVGLALWFEVGCKKSRTVSVTLARCQELGMGKSTARRGLRDLERAELISTNAPPGRARTITVLDVPVPVPDTQVQPHSTTIQEG